MKTHIAGAVKKPDRDAQKKSDGWLQLLKEPALQLLAVSLVAGVLVLWWQMARLQNQLVEAVALAHAHAYAQTLKELGGVYATEVGARAKTLGTEVAFDYKKKANILPSFSALVTKAGDAIHTDPTAPSARFYSFESLSGQGKNSEALIGFGQDSWTSLAKNPDHAVSRFDNTQGHATLHYAIGWKEGETKGVLEIVLPLERLMLHSGAYRTTSFTLLTGLSLLGACLLGMILTRVRREAKAAELRSLALEHEFTEQEKIIRAYEREFGERKRQEEEILNAAEVLADVTNYLRKSTSELASSATEMAAAVNETTATVEEVKQTAALSSQKAQQVSATAQKAAQISQAGKQATEDTIAEMQQIRDQMQSIADSIMKLSEQSQVIREIIDTVNDLAEQSNLLAVNASIEAQKAGAHGSGFVVVAQEVRNLAQQSKDATMQVQAILNDIERATSASVQITAQGANAAEAGMKQSVEAGESIRTLAQSVQEAAQSATMIATSNQQQAIGMDQLVQAMHNIQEGSMQTVTSTRQVEGCVQRLQELEQRLADLSERLSGAKRTRAPEEQSSLMEAA